MNGASSFSHEKQTEKIDIFVTCSSKNLNRKTSVVVLNSYFSRFTPIGKIGQRHLYLPFPLGISRYTQNK
jgi:hypothetical protein